MILYRVEEHYYLEYTTDDYIITGNVKFDTYSVLISGEIRSSNNTEIGVYSCKCYKGGIVSCNIGEMNKQHLHNVQNLISDIANFLFRTFNLDS